jgi:two-component system response regulator DesR
VTRQRPRPPGRDEPGAAAASATPRLLLVVGDDRPVRAALAALPGLARARVLAAADAETAAARLPEGGVDLVLTEVELPGRSGIWLAEWVAMHAPAVRVVLMSATLPPSGTVFPRSVLRFVRPPISRGVLLEILADAPAGP